MNRDPGSGDIEIKMPRAALVAGALLTALVFAPGGASRSGGNREQIRFNAADQAAARAAVLRRADLGSGWTGGSIKADVGSGPNCPGYNPKQSDLVLTGAASTRYRHTGVDLRSDAQVLQTRKMVAADWRRTVLASGTLSCLRRTLVRGLTANERLVSMAKTSFPHLARYSTRFRAVLEVQVQGQRPRVLVDIVLVGRSRTELTLTVTGPAAAKQSLSAAEVRLARGLLARVRA